MDYKTFLTHTYPMMQSYLPGGINYDWHSSLRQRVVLFEQAAKDLLVAAEQLNCSHIGKPNEFKLYDPLVFIERFGNHGCNRNDKKAWRRLCTENGYVINNEDWWMNVLWGPLKAWAEFRAEIKAYANQQRANKG